MAWSVPRKNSFWIYFIALEVKSTGEITNLLCPSLYISMYTTLKNLTNVLMRLYQIIKLHPLMDCWGFMGTVVTSLAGIGTGLQRDELKRWVQATALSFFCYNWTMLRVLVNKVYLSVVLLSLQRRLIEDKTLRTTHWKTIPCLLAPLCILGSVFTTLWQLLSFCLSVHQSICSVCLFT